MISRQSVVSQNKVFLFRVFCIVCISYLVIVGREEGDD